VASVDVQNQTQAEQEQQRQQSAPGSGGNRSQLVQRLLDASANLPQFVHDLIQTQAVTVAGTEAAAFLIERQGPAPEAQGDGEAAEAGDDAAEPGAKPGPANTGPKLMLRPIAHIRPDGADTRLMHLVREVEIAAVHIGMPVEPVWAEGDSSL